MDYSNDKNIAKSSLVAFTPDVVLSSHTRVRRRNLLGGIFLSLSLVYLGAAYPSAKIQSILFVRLDQPIDDASPILFILAFYIGYFLLSFIFDLYADMMQQLVRISGLRPYKTVCGSESLEYGRDTFLLADISKDKKNLVKVDKNQDDLLGMKVVNVQTSETFHVRDIFLSHVRTNFHDRVAVRKLYDDGKSKNFHSVEKEDLSDDEKTQIEALEQAWSALAIKKYKRHVHRSFLWWFEIAIPILSGLITLSLLLTIGFSI